MKHYLKIGLFAPVVFGSLVCGVVFFSWLNKILDTHPQLAMLGALFLISIFIAAWIMDEEAKNKMTKLAILASCAVVYAGCSQKHNQSSDAINLEVYTVKLRSSELLDAAQDYELESSNLLGHFMMVNSRAHLSQISTNPFTIIYHREQGKFFTNWLAHSRPKLFDKFWVHWMDWHNYQWTAGDSNGVWYSNEYVYSNRFVQLPPDPPPPKPHPSSKNLALAPIMSAGGHSVTLAWTMSPSPKVIYQLHYGPEAGVYTNWADCGTNLSWTLTGFNQGDVLYICCMALDSNGLMSEPSNEVVYNVPAPPGPPGSLRITAYTASSSAGPWLVFTNMPAVVVAGTETNRVYKLGIEKVNE